EAGNGIGAVGYLIASELWKFRRAVVIQIAIVFREVGKAVGDWASWKHHIEFSYLRPRLVRCRSRAKPAANYTAIGVRCLLDVVDEHSLGIDLDFCARGSAEVGWSDRITHAHVGERRITGTDAVEECNVGCHRQRLQVD